MSVEFKSFARRLAVAMVVSLLAFDAHSYIAGTSEPVDWDDPGDGKRFLLNGYYYGQNPCWNVTLKAGTVGSLFDDTLGPVRVFEYETVVTVDGVETLVIPGGTYRSNMGDSSYNVQIPLKELGILEPEACGRHYLTAYTRNYENGVDIHYTILVEDTYVDITYEDDCNPENYSVKIFPKNDRAHPDGVMLKVEGTLPKGTAAKIYRDGNYIYSVTGKCYLFDREENSSSAPRTFNYKIEAESKCGEEKIASCTGTQGMARIGKMSITNENYEAFVVKYDQPKNLTIEFTDAEELVAYEPSVVSLVSGSTTIPRDGKLETQELEEKMTASKIIYTIDNQKFEEGSHGNYTFVDEESYYIDNEVGLKHVIPEGLEYEPAKSRVLFMRDDYFGMPGVYTSIDNGSKEINWFRYWQKDRDGTVDLLQKNNNIRLGCQEKWQNGTGGSLGHAAFHTDGKHWVCLVSKLASSRTEAFNLPGTSITVGAGLDGNDETAMACPSNDCHQVAATITHELQHREVLKKWFDDVGLEFAIDGSANHEGDTTSGWFWYRAWRRKLFNGEVNRIHNDVDHDYSGTIGDHLSDATERDLLRIGWTCDLNSSVNGVSATDAIRQLQFDITKADTYNIASVNPLWSSYATYGDNEVCARMSERYYDRDGVHTNRDWSVKNPEKLKIGSQRATGANMRIAANVKTASSGTEDEFGSCSFACSNAPDYEIPREFSLIGISSQDGDAVKDGTSQYYSGLSFNVSVSSLTNNLSEIAGTEFRISGYLADDTGRIIAGTSADVSLGDSGEASAMLDFDGKILYNARGFGYNLAAVVVELGGVADVVDVPVACVTNVAKTVRTFDYSEFSRSDVVVDRTSFSESTDGTNLLVGISAEINTPGTYTLYGILVASNHTIVGAAERVVNLSAGTNTFHLAFSGDRIAGMGEDGPYELELVRLTREDGSPAAVLIDSYITTNSYNASALRPASDGTMIEFIPGTTQWLDPVEENGSIISLRYSFQVENPLPSNITCSVQSLLEGGDGDVAGFFKTNITFVIGTNTVVLDFPSDKSKVIGEGGSFRVRSISIVSSSGDSGRVQLAPSKPSPEFVPKSTVSAAFKTSAVSVNENDMLTVYVMGGSLENEVSIAVCLAYNTAVAADIDLANGAIDGVKPEGGLKFPLTLSWERGEVGEKVITIPVKKDFIIESDESFVLMLENPSGMEIGDVSECVVTIVDATVAYTVTFDANEGSVTETSRKVAEGTAIGTLPKPTRDGYSFLGWFTEAEGGTQISSSTVVAGDVAFYAHWTDQVLARFTDSELSVEENDSMTVRVVGGNPDKASRVDVYLTYNTAVAADVDLAKGELDGTTPKGGLKFPLTLSWAKGEVGEKVITIPVKADKAVEGDEFFTMQLASAQGVELGETTVCTVTIKDTNTNLTLQEGMLSPTVTATTKGDGKWFVAAGSPLDEEGLLPLYHVESPALAQEKSSTLALSAVKGMGVLYFSIRFSGDPGEETPSRLDVYEGKTILGSFSHADVTNEWAGYKITINSMSGSRAYSFVFTQGSDPNTHAEVSDVVWDSFGNITLTDFYRVYATPDNPAGGIVSGSGWYSDGQVFKLSATPFPGWTFDGWYEAVEDEEAGEIGYFFWNKSAKVSYRINRNVNVVAIFSKVPYVRGLADPADGGKVSGSGLCARGKKVTLKASANKNFTFLGWVLGGRGATALPDDGDGRAGSPLPAEDGDYVATTASLVIDRSAKPAKDSKTSTTLTNVAEDVTYYAVFKSDPEIFVTVDATDGTGAEPTGKGADKYVAGTITGMGKYAPGKKVTLKATANKGYVFAGWLDANGELLTKDASYTIAAMGESDVEYTAKFVTADEDKASITLALAMGAEAEALGLSTNEIVSITNFCGVAMNWQLAAEALSAATIKVAGLPAGLKFTAKDILKKGSKTEVEIPANTIYGAPTAASKTDRNGVVTPSKVVFTATTAGKSTQTFALNLYIDPLPAWAVGTFDGVVGNGELGTGNGGSAEATADERGTAALTIAANGKISGKLLRDDGTWALSAGEFSRVEHVERVDGSPESEAGSPVFFATVVGKSGKLLETNDVTVAASGVSGRTASEPSISWTAFQNLWKRADTKTDMPVIKKDIKVDHWLGEQDDANNKLTLTFKKDGVVAFTGMVDGAKVSGSSQLVLVRRDEGTALCQVTLYVPPKTTAKPPVESWCKAFTVTLTLDGQNVVTDVAVSATE